MPNFDQFICHLRYALAVVETKKPSIAATICGVETSELLKGIEKLEDLIGLKLFFIDNDCAKETNSGINFKSYLIENIEKLQKFQHMQQSKTNASSKRVVKKVGVVGQNPFSTKVMPEFSGLVQSRCNISFDIVQFHNPKEALNALVGKYTDYGVFIPQNSLLESKRIKENLDICSIVNLYPLKFAMITNENLEIRTLSDLRGKNVAGEFPVSQAMQFMTNIYLDSARRANERFNLVRCRNVSQSYKLLKTGRVRATIYPMDAIRSEEIISGSVLFVNGEIIRSQKAKLLEEYPSAKILRQKNMDGNVFNIIQLPLMMFGRKDEDPDSIELLIESAMRFFQRFVRHKADRSLSDRFFDPESSGIRRHRATTAFFNT